MTDESIASLEAEGIASRWVSAHMTARQGLIDDIARSLINARRLERDWAEGWIRNAEGDGVASDYRRDVEVKP